MRKSTPSDVSRMQVRTIRPLLKNACTKASPRRVELYDILCVVLYAGIAACTGSNDGAGVLVLARHGLLDRGKHHAA